MLCHGVPVIQISAINQQVGSKLYYLIYQYLSIKESVHSIEEGKAKAAERRKQMEQELAEAEEALEAERERQSAPPSSRRAIATPGHNQTPARTPRRLGF